MSEAIYHRRYQEPDKVDEDGNEIEWPVPFWWIDIGATMQTIMLAAVDEGLGSGFVGPRRRRAPRLPRLPAEFTPIGVMPVGRPLPDVRSPSLKRGWVPFEAVRPLGSLDTGPVMNKPSAGATEHGHRPTLGMRAAVEEPVTARGRFVTDRWV